MICFCIPAEKLKDFKKYLDKLDVGTYIQIVDYATINMTEQKTYRQEDCIGYLISRVSRSLNRKMSQGFCSSGSDVSAQQWLVIAKLWENDGLNQQELSSYFAKDKTGMARMLNNRVPAK